MTIKEHLIRQLVPQVYELAVKNIIKQYGDDMLNLEIDNPPIKNSLYSLIMDGETVRPKDAIHCFYWDKTPEGWDFWANINRMLKLDYL